MSSRDLFKKVQSIFGDLAVNKWLASAQEYSMLPRYVVEYLVLEFMYEYGPRNYAQKLSEFISTHYKEARERNKILHDLMNGSEVELIDEVKVEADVIIGDYRTHLMNLGIKDAMVSKPVINEYENLLVTGMWGPVSYTHLTLPTN